MSEAGPALRIFIGYRRDDSQGFARSIHDRLAHHFGPDAVFRDINDIEPGMPWEEAIDEALGTCDVFVLLIGRGWLGATDDEGNRRIDDPEDRHRREIETAINRKIRMFVALMEDATMPGRKQLPQGQESEGLQKVPTLHALRIADHAFDYGIEELISSIERAAEHARADAKQEVAQGAKRQREADAERERADEARKRGDGEPRREEEKTDWEEKERRRRLGRLAAVALVAVAAVVVVFLIVPFGNEDGAPEPKLYLEPITIEGFPVGLNIHGNQVTVASRTGMTLTTIEKMTREPAGEPVALPGEGEDVVTMGKFAWVTLPQDNQVAQVSLDEGSVETFDVGEEPRGIAASSDALWVADLASGEISKIVPSTGEVTPISLEDGSQPTDIAFDEGSLWVTDRANARVIRIDAAGVQSEFEVGPNPKGIVVADGDVWVANTGNGTVSRLGTDGTEREPINIGGTPRGIAAGLGFIWVANGDGHVSAIDPETGEYSQVDVEGSPEQIATGPDRMWVTTGSGNSLVSIDPPSR